MFFISSSFVSVSRTKVDKRGSDNVRQMADGTGNEVVLFIIQDQWDCMDQGDKLAVFFHFFPLERIRWGVIT